MLLVHTDHPQGNIFTQLYLNKCCNMKEQAHPKKYTFIWNIQKQKSLYLDLVIVG